MSDNSKIEWCDATWRRFWTSIRPRPDNGCWMWTRGCFSSGYGQFRLRHKKWRTHRLMWLTIHGSIPDGMCVCHTCDNPACVNPAHLFIGTHADNARDRERKGRHPHGPNPKHGRPGASNPAAKMTEGEVVELRYRRHKHHATYRALAARFCISPSQVANIVKGRSWQTTQR